MNDLNKNQLVLLTLLVSFVTSIGTGIITVALLQQAPTGVTQVINRVVERTIEQVTPVNNGENTQVKETQVTVVVKEEDQVIDAISKNAKSIIRIKDNALVDGVSLFYGMGVLVTKDGLVMSGKRDSANTASTYTGTASDGKSYVMKYIGSDEQNRVSFFKIILEPKATISATPAIFSTRAPQLGQTAITLDGIEKNAVSIGRITSLVVSPEGSKDVSLIETDISVDPKTTGGPLLNLSGEMIGLRASLSETNQSFVPSTQLQKSITEFSKL